MNFIDLGISLDSFVVLCLGSSRWQFLFCRHKRSDGQTLFWIFWIFFPKSSPIIFFFILQLVLCTCLVVSKSIIYIKILESTYISTPLS